LANYDSNVFGLLGLDLSAELLSFLGSLQGTGLSLEMLLLLVLADGFLEVLEADVLHKPLKFLGVA
jgi:hypothetical protein